MKRAALALALAAGGVSPAASEEGPSCAILGQMAVASWLRMSGKLASPHAGAVDPALSRLGRLSQIRTEMGCDPTVLRASLDCLMLLARQGAPKDLARHCMAETGMIGK